ncbi:C-type lectin domain family 2 member A-like [Pleurodeles waltl]|uniref:C-type lectin domain family 2 member A-like n=1 Tax=Pleurodeles waltl TaxID=8319 RepID=UPI0037094515
MDWLYSRNKCYYFSVMYRKEGDWDESQRFCSSHKGSLALFDTQEDLNFLMDISGEHHVWVGLRKREDGIHWANGTTCSSSLSFSHGLEICGRGSWGRGRVSAGDCHRSDKCQI